MQFRKYHEMLTFTFKAFLKNFLVKLQKGKQSILPTYNQKVTIYVIGQGAMLRLELIPIFFVGLCW